MSLWRTLFRHRPANQPAPFIVGVARSGTTLLRLMLDSHPDLTIPPETYFLLPFLRRPQTLVQVNVEEFCGAVSGFHTWPDLGLPAELLAREAKALRRFSLAEGTRLVYRLYARQRGKPRWGDKTPAYCRYMPGVENVLPEAHFVHIIRDGRDVALSLRRQWFTPAQDMAGLARHWVEEVTATRRDGVRCRRYLEIRYEDLLVETRGTLKRVCEFVKLPFHPAMEDYHRTASSRLGEIGDQRLPDGRIITRESRLARLRLAGSPPDRSRIGVWRGEMAADEHKTFTSIAGDLLRSLGYEA